MSNSVRIMSICILLASVLIMFNGCAGHIALQKEAMSSINSVSINKEVPKPEKIEVIGASQFLLAGLGGIGGAVVGAELAKKPAAILKAVMEKEGIDMGQIVREQFVDQLKNSGSFNTIVDEGGDAEFKLTVVGASFMKPGGFTHKLKLNLTVEGILVKPDGSILWKNREAVTINTSGTPRYHFKEYINNPELIREVITICSRIVSDKLVNDMLGK